MCLCESATCVFVSVRGKTVQINRVSSIEKGVLVLVKPSQVSEKVTMTSKLYFVNSYHFNTS